MRTHIQGPIHKDTYKDTHIKKERKTLGFLVASRRRRARCMRYAHCSCTAASIDRCCPAALRTYTYGMLVLCVPAYRTVCVHTRQCVHMQCSVCTYKKDNVPAYKTVCARTRQCVHVQDSMWHIIQCVRTEGTHKVRCA
jgi:hypothetical protein